MWQAIVVGWATSFPLTIAAIVGLWLQWRATKRHVDAATDRQTRQIAEKLDAQTQEIKADDRVPDD